MKASPDVLVGLAYCLSRSADANVRGDCIGISQYEAGIVSEMIQCLAEMHDDTMAAIERIDKLLEGRKVN